MTTAAAERATTRAAVLRRLPLAGGAVASTTVAVGGSAALPAAAGAALALTGVAVLLLCWWRLRDRPLRTQLQASVAWAVPLLAAPPLFSHDLYAYAGQARLVLTGLDPYSHGPADAPGPLADRVDPVWAHTPTPYGPVWLRLAAAVVGLTGQRPAAAVLTLRLLAAAGLVLLTWGLLRLAAARGAAPARVVWLAVANPLMLLHGLGGGHNDLLMAGLLVLGLSMAERSPAAAGALVAVAGLVKAPALLALAFLPLLGGGRVLPAAGRVAAAAGLGAAAVTGLTGLGWGWAGALGDGDGPRSLLSLTTGAGLALGSVTAAHLAGLALAALVTGALLLRARRGDPLPALGRSLLAVALLAPAVQTWYLLWGLPLLALTAGRRTAAALAAGSAVLALLILPSGRHLVRPPLYGAPMLLAVAAAVAAAVAVGGRPRVKSAPVG